MSVQVKRIARNQVRHQITSHQSTINQAQLVKTAPNFNQKSALLLVVAIQPLTHEDCHVLSESREC